MLVSKITYDGRGELAEEIGIAAGGDRDSIPWPLPNMKPVAEPEFWGWRASQGFKAEVWADQRKVEIDGITRWANILLFWVDCGHLAKGGFAVAVDRTYGEERVRYFEWRACAHDFKETRIGNCLYRYTCQQCGQSYDIDSSG